MDSRCLERVSQKANEAHLKVRASTGTSRLSALGLLSPFVRTDLGYSSLWLAVRRKREGNEPEG